MPRFEQKFFPQEQEYIQEAKTIRERQENLLGLFHQRLDLFFPGNDVRSDFLIDGSPVVSQSHLLNLPKEIRRYLADGRISMPPNLHIFVDTNNVSDAIGERVSGFSVRNLNKAVSLRGRRFYEADGKYQWGPNELHAHRELVENLKQNLDLLPSVLDLSVSNREDWVTRISLLDYLRNDLYVLYYLKCSQLAIEGNNDQKNHEIDIVEKTLELSSRLYFDNLLLINSNNFPVEAYKESYTTSVKIAEDLSGFVESLKLDPTKRTLDIIRAHRELGTPQALMAAWNFLTTSDHLRESDLIIAPLYGALDIGQALDYLMKNSTRIVEQLGLAQNPFPEKLIKIKYILQKISRVGTPRSAQAGVLQSLPARHMTLDTVSPKSKQLVKDAKRITIVDDSAGTLGSINELIEWVIQQKNGDKDYSIHSVVAHAGLRWAPIQGASMSALGQMDPVSLTPLSRLFKKPAYAQPGRSGGSPYLPDKSIDDSNLRTERTFSSFPDLLPIIESLFNRNVITAVGYDLYETLVRRDVSREVRRNDLNEIYARVFQKYSIRITTDEVRNLTRPVWELENKKAKAQGQEINFFNTIKLMVEEVYQAKNMFLEDLKINSIAAEICREEIEYEVIHTHPDEGVLDLINKLNNKGIVQGIFSNTPYPSEYMITILTNCKIVPQLIPLEHCLFSSSTKVVKPEPETLYRLSGVLGCSVTDLAFVGNSNDDILAARRARAVAIHRLFDEESIEKIQRLDQWKFFVAQMVTE